MEVLNSIRQDVPVGDPLFLSTLSQKWNEVPKWSGVEGSQLIYGSIYNCAASVARSQFFPDLLNIILARSDVLSGGDSG